MIDYQNPSVITGGYSYILGYYIPVDTRGQFSYTFNSEKHILIK